MTVRLQTPSGEPLLSSTRNQTISEIGGPSPRHLQHRPSTHQDVLHNIVFATDPVARRLLGTGSGENSNLLWEGPSFWIPLLKHVTRAFTKRGNPPKTHYHAK